MARTTIAIALYFCLRALIHSVLASLAVKRWARHIFGPRHERWYRLAFNAVAGLTLLPVLAMVLWLPDRTLYTIPFPRRWLSLAGQCVAPTALVWTALQTDVLRALASHSSWPAILPSASHYRCTASTAMSATHSICSVWWSCG